MPGSAGTKNAPRGSVPYGEAGKGSRTTEELRAWTLVLPPGAAFTHATAASVRRWWLAPLPEDLPVFVAVPDAGWRPRRRGLHVSRHTSPVGFTLVDGLPTADPCEIVLAAARHLGLVDLVILSDSALHRGDVTIDQLTAAAIRRRRGAPALRAALPMMDGRAESPGETLMRLLHVTCGIEVEPQAPIVDDYGRIIARADLRIIGTRRLAEYDGAHHRAARQYETDRARDRRLQALGWSPYSYSAITVLRQPHLIIRDADEALGRMTDSRLLGNWYQLIENSTFTAPGLVRLRARLGLPRAPGG
ncbi:MAG: hypothetical protein M3400_05770 [Actinomycetota bacterium]|nr:hypothetical protein [Actinomycetota bacterium]